MIKIGVIGTGTVGILAISHLLGYLNNDFKVVSIHDPNTKILGVGESSQPAFLSSLYKGANFKITEDAHELDATIKLGGKWIDWRENPFTMTFLPPSMGMHFNNFKLKEFCFKRFKALWCGKFEIIEGEVLELKNINDSAVSVNVDQKIHIFDYIMDCRGFPEDYSNYNILDSIPVNHALIYNNSTPGNWNTTINQAVKHGWMFHIPLQSRNASGYLYNDSITSKKEVIEDMSKMFEISEDNLNLNEFTFKNYRAKTYFDGRIMLNGNRALFYEPIEALSNYMYDTINRNFFDYITIIENNKTPNKFMISTINGKISNLATDTEIFINFAYHGGSTHNTKFWNITKDKCSLFLNQSLKWKNIKNEISKSSDNSGSVAHWHVGHWKEWDENLGYNYFKQPSEKG